MAARVDQFSAKDAFIYTDTYRRAIGQTAASITTEKERLKERLRRGEGGDSCFYAELRALEHAMSFVVKREEPRYVLLGEVDGGAEPLEARESRLNDRINELQGMLNQEKAEKEKLKKDLSSVGEAYGKLQVETGDLRNLVARLQRKVVQTSSTFGVVGFALFVVIVVLLVVQAGR